MLRFGDKAAAKRSTASRERRGIWMLLLMLGLVMLLMRQLQRPEAAALMGHVFAPAAQPASGRSNQGAQVDSDSAEASAPRNDNDQSHRTNAAPLGGAWAAVKDNALFSADEQGAWFSLFEKVQQTPADDLARQSLGEASYVQLINQPDAYRARVVRVRGRVLRESVKRAPANAVGIESYHQLWLAPAGGGEWPMVVYALELPAGFPRGERIAADVTADGLFFKNWSFPYEGGMGLAPVIVARTVNWKVPPTARPREAQPMDEQRIIIGIGVAATAAMLFMAWVVRQSRRPRIIRSERTADLSRLEAES